MKKLPVLLLFASLLAGCSTWTSYHAEAPAGPRTPPDYPIPVYSPDLEPPRPCKSLGDLSIDRTPLTVFGGGIDIEMEKVMKQAHARGADVVQVLAIQTPGFSSGSYSVQARLLRYADVWEKVALSETELKAYLKKNRAALDPIEGIWTDGLPHKLGIVRDATKPGREFIAYTLTPDLASWQPGYKKMDIARGVAPGSYDIKYYREDFLRSDVIVTLEQNGHFRFNLHYGENAFPIVFTKLKL
jgi:hypothetical protein